MSSQAVRLVDVARAAGVSMPTASQVMNGTGRVAEETRRRVLEAARRLDYRPNALARSVASGRSRTIGVLAENAAGAFCMPVLIGINRELSSHDFASILFDAHHDAELRHEHVRRMLDRQVDGIIVIGEGADVPIAPLGVDFVGPVVRAYGPPDAEGAVSIHPDEFEGGVLAARRLVEMGRTRIAHVTAGGDLTSARERERGFLHALAEAGLEPAAILHGSFSRSWGLEAAVEIVETVPAVDAVFAGSDAIAVGLAAGLESRGRSVPGDVALIGYDNLAGYSDDTQPYLESVDPRLTEVGHAAARYLVGVLAGGDSSSSAPIGPALAPGASTRGDADPARQSLVDALLRSITAPPVGSTL
ncbi:LacI family transcriptional regulator [Microbacterium resistens]|uniref:LacI family transcriptional regulator n=1 Tax=Microbacterium resistens TaxID=156977 RepID=A0ABU1SEV1_9MICO|nr:LacI family DNA-binding transcriptional regulator [Microbacterium resistens]MDR6867458.1 LacI family transcriptional regulator [Microbacterium resistens]